MSLENSISRLIACAQAHLGDPYVFGMWGQPCSPQARRQYARYNPAHQAWIYRQCPVLSGSQPACEGCAHQGALAFDCRGFTYWCLMQAGIALAGSGATSQYHTRANWAQRGEMAGMPDAVCCVFMKKGSKMSHTGLHIGGGEIIHCAYNARGVQRGCIIDKGWTHYAVPKGLYEALDTLPVLTSKTTLRRGDRGESVQKLQSDLNALGFACGEADGIYGAKTCAAVRAFQRAQGLSADGIAGWRTHWVLARMLEKAA